MPCSSPINEINPFEWKFNMLIDGFKILFDTNKENSIKDIIMLKNIDEMLCKLCQSLEKYELLSIQGSGPYQMLSQWYADHLINDIAINSNDDAETQKRIDEAARLGWKIETDERGSWSLTI